MALGLKRGTVALSPHTPEWARAFAEERRRLADALSTVECQIEHVGSTAVPGLIAKPVLDVAVGLGPWHSPDRYVPVLERLGYIYRGDAAAEGGHVFVRESAEQVRTHHLHLVSLQDPQWDNYLLLRDHLRASESARAAYTAAKQALSSRFPLNRKSYTAEKGAVVHRLLDQARHEGRKDRAWRYVAALDAAHASGDLDDDGWYRGMADLVVPAYTNAADVRRGSGHTGTEEDWEWSRGIVADAIDRSGTFLDVGCANGLLMESVVRWGAARGLVIEPYGLDIAPELAALARGRLPQWASNVFVGNALGWRPPRRFDVVRTGLEYVPRPRRRDLVRWILDEIVGPGGHLIVGKYNEEIDSRTVEQELTSWGLAITGRWERGHRTEPRLVYRALSLRS